MMWKAEHKWNLLISILAVSLSIPCRILPTYYSPHPAPSQFFTSEAAERLPLVAPFLKVDLCDCWYFPSGETHLCPLARGCCSIAPCIACLRLEAALSRLQRVMNTFRLGRLARGHSPQWFLLRSSLTCHSEIKWHCCCVLCWQSWQNTHSLCHH